jgi:hypothetical protein
MPKNRAQGGKCTPWNATNDPRAEELSHAVRQEGWAGPRLWRVYGRRYIFDLALSAVEQLDQLASALADDPAIHSVKLPAAMQPLVMHRRAA